MSAPLISSPVDVTFSSQTYPAGTSYDHVVVSVVGTAAGNTTPLTQNVPAQTAAGDVTLTFNLVPDTYTLTATCVDASGNPIAAITPVSSTDVITQPTTVTLVVPTAIGA